MSLPSVTDTVICGPNVSWMRKPVIAGNKYIVAGIDLEANVLIVADAKGHYRAPLDCFEQVGESTPVPEWVTQFLIDCFGGVVYVDTYNKHHANKSNPKEKVSYTDIHSPRLYPKQGIF